MSVNQRWAMWLAIGVVLSVASAVILGLISTDRFIGGWIAGSIMGACFAKSMERK